MILGAHMTLPSFVFVLLYAWHVCFVDGLACWRLNCASRTPKSLKLVHCVYLTQSVFDHQKCICLVTLRTSLFLHLKVLTFTCPFCFFSSFPTFQLMWTLDFDGVVVQGRQVLSDGRRMFVPILLLGNQLYSYRWRLSWFVAFCNVVYEWKKPL